MGFGNCICSINIRFALESVSIDIVTGNRMVFLLLFALLCDNIFVCRFDDPKHNSRVIAAKMSKDCGMCFIWFSLYTRSWRRFGSWGHFNAIWNVH